MPSPQQNVSAGLPLTTHTTIEGTALAHAFDRARHHKECIELLSVGVPPDGCAELAGAVHAFVVARRADGAPPERVLATIKSVLPPSFVPGADEARGDRLHALILREFLASYYGATISAPPASSRSNE